MTRPAETLAGATELLERSTDELLLSTRAGQCLERLGISRIGQLVLWSPRELRAQRGLGPIVLAEIESALGKRGLALTTPPSDEVAREPQVLTPRQVALCERHVTELRMPGYAHSALRRTRIRTIGELVRWTPLELRQVERIGPRSVRSIEAALAASDLRLGAEIEWPAAGAPDALPEEPRPVPTLDADFDLLLNPFEEPGLRAALRQWLGWGGGQQPRTGVTVTRWSVLCLRRHWQGLPPRLLAVERAVMLIEAIAPCRSEAAELAITAAGLAPSGCAIEAVLAAAGLAEIPHRLSLFGKSPRRWLVTREWLREHVRVSAVARAVMRSRRITSVAEICARLQGGLRRRLSRELVGSHVATMPDVVDLGAGWFCHRRALASDAPLLRRIEPMLSCCGPLDISSLRQGLMRRVRNAGVAPRSALLAFCRQSSRLEVDGDRVARKRGSPARTFNKHEMLVVKLLAASPRPVAGRAVIEGLVRAGVRPVTAQAALMRCAAVERVAGPRRYRLRTLSRPGQRVRASPSKPAGWVAVGAGYKGAWVAWRVGPAALEGQPMPMPAELAKLPARIDARFRAGARVGTLGHTGLHLTGLGEILLWLGAEVGDLVVVIFRKRGRVTVGTVLLGTREIVDRLRYLERR